MHLLGPYTIGTLEQRQLAPGASWDLPRARILPKYLAKARIGDLFWLQEPWALYESRRHGRQHIQEAVPGPWDTPPPAFIKPFAHQLRLRRFENGLARGDSRITLEIMGMPEHAVRVIIHFQNVADFMQARRAA